MSVFQTAARTAFGFLETEFCFQVASSGADRISYERGSFVVLVRYDSQRSYELTVDLGDRQKDQPLFNLGEALRSLGLPQEHPSAYQVAAENALPEFLERLATDLKTHGTPILGQEPGSLNNLRQLRNRECEEFARERDLRHARANVSKAWKAGDYGSVIRWFEPVEKWLSKSEQMKLNLARKKFGSTEA